MKFDLVTIFPEIFNSYTNESIIGRAQADALISIATHNVRDYAENKHNTVDDKPYGGGVGMVMQVGPIYRCLKSIERSERSRVIYLSPRGKRWNQQMAQEYATKYDQLILVSGRYEGIDERAMNYIDEEISIGDYVLTGGELASLVLVDSVARLVPGVLGKDESSHDESHSRPGYIEYPHYTRPEVFIDDDGNEYGVPETLLSGHHKKIEEWREDHAQQK